MTTENVVQLPDALERLSTRIKSNLARADKLGADWNEVVAAVAVDVAQMRNMHIKDDVSFGKWWDVQELKLNGRALDHHDRAALVRMGEKPDVLRDILASTDRRSIRTIYDEHKERFTNIGKPTRRQGERKKRAAPKLDKVKEEVERLVREGKPVSRDQIAAKHGVGQLTVHLAITYFKGVLAGEASRHAAHLAPEPRIDPKTLSMTAQQRLDAVMKQERKRLEAENKAYLDQQIDFHIKRLKTEHLPRWEDDAKRARLSRERYQKLINDHKPPLNKAEYQLILLTAHEDNSASTETRKRATIILNNKKFVLTGEQ